jgi:hypothetical protein
MTAMHPDAGDPRPDLARIREALGVLYRELDQAVARHQPVCELSGRCCRFRDYGHTLFLSAPEAALLLADAPPPARGLDDGATCPWQDARGRCTAREARPVGCRVFFCDPRFETILPELAEEFTGRLKRLVEAEGWAWDYAPLHRHLSRAWPKGAGGLAAASHEVAGEGSASP